MLQITLVIEDKISLDELQEEIAEFEDFVQSTDVAGEFKSISHWVVADSHFSYAEIVRDSYAVHVLCSSYVLITLLCSYPALTTPCTVSHLYSRSTDSEQLIRQSGLSNSRDNLNTISLVLPCYYAAMSILKAPNTPSAIS
jgi:hypothetical protein